MKILHILLGLLLGIVLVLSPLGVFVFALFLLCLYYMKEHVSVESRDFLIKLLIIGFAVRIIFACFYYVVGLLLYQAADIQPDALVYNLNSFYTANILRGTEYFNQFIKEPFITNNLYIKYRSYKGMLPNFGLYQNPIYVNMLGVIFAWFGYSPIAAKLLNALFGCSTAIATYFLAKTLTKSEKASRISAGITMFFPSMIYWSVTLLRDSIYNFLFLIYTVFLVRCARKKGLAPIFAAFSIFLIIGTFRTKMWPLFLIGFVFALTVNLFQRVMKARRITKLLVLTSAYIGLIVILILGHEAIGNFIDRAFVSVIRIHKLLFLDPSDIASAFKLYTDPIYRSQPIDLRMVSSFELVISGFKSIAYYFFSPFPWHIPLYSVHPLLLLFYPFSVFNILTFPFVILGIIAALRRNFATASFTVLLIALFLIPQAMAEGVVGSIVRHRVAFMPFVFIFLSYGFSILVGPKKSTPNPRIEK